MLKGKLDMLLKNMIRSRVIVQNMIASFLYSNIENVKITQSNLHKLEEQFFNISYNEKLKTPQLSDCLLNFDRTKVYWLNWCSKTPVFKHYNDQILRSA